MATCLTSPEYLATEALALLAAAGKAEFEVRAEVSRRRDGSFRFDLSTYDPDPVRNTFDLHFTCESAESLDEVLLKTAGRLGLSYPLALTITEPVYTVVGEAYKIAA